MYICNLCNKVFPSPSKLNKHNTRKTSCDKPKEELKCQYCNVSFTRPAEKLRHEKTNKHINNYNNNQQDNILDLEKIELNKEIYTLKQELINIKNINNQLYNENKNLHNHIQILEKNAAPTLNHTQKIYIMHERTFMLTNTNIYKIGKTKNIKNRLKGYAKGSDLIYTIPCDDCDKYERLVLNYLKLNTEKYIQRKDFGNEYFQCNLDDLIDDISGIIKNRIQL
jgi:hypothetical protein